MNSISQFDRTRLAAMVGNTTCLALAYYFTNNETYAVKAADNIRTWFLDADTAMAPSSKYAQVWCRGFPTASELSIQKPLISPCQHRFTGE